MGALAMALMISGIFMNTIPMRTTELSTIEYIIGPIA